MDNQYLVEPLLSDIRKYIVYSSNIPYRYIVIFGTISVSHHFVHIRILYLMQEIIFSRSKE